MKKLTTLLLQYALKLSKYFAIFVLSYVVIMTIAHFIPNQFNPNTVHHQHEQNIDIYIVSNGVHTDFVLPTKTTHINWADIFNPNDTPNKTINEWISIGWGDREFYLNTPTWADLTAKNALYALSGLSRSALHVSYESNTYVQSCKKCRKITISPVQYQAIITHIQHSLPYFNQQLPIPNVHYTANDAFYPAIGSYNLFYTCNSWVNNGLKKANIKTALWTVLDEGVIKER